MDSAVAARLDALEAERAILRTLSRYGHAIDYGCESAWLECFHENATFEIRSRVRGTRMVATGRAELSAFIAAHTRAPARYHKHLTANALIVIDGERATSESLYTRIDADAAGVPYLYSFGRYRDRLSASVDGTWRFEERIAESESLSDRTW